MTNEESNRANEAFGQFLEFLKIPLVYLVKTPKAHINGSEAADLSSLDLTSTKLSLFA